MKLSGNLPRLLESFFTERLISQKRVSSHTIASYRDTFRMLLGYASGKLKKVPSAIMISELDATLIGAFLNDLEQSRGVGARSRNQRLAAIRSFFHYLAFELPDHSSLIQRVLSIPRKRYERALVEFLTKQEVDALLSVSDRRTWTGRRDYALLLVAVQTGLRVSELVSLCQRDIELRTGAHVRCIGKGRKQRCTPLTKQTASILRSWLQEQKLEPSNPVFPNARGGALSSDGVQYIIDKYIVAAGRKCISLQKKKVSPHVLRHTTAMQLLQSGVDRSVIALWLGHESVETTQIYLDANLQMKEEILKKTELIKIPPGRFRPDDQLMSFLKAL